MQSYRLFFRGMDGHFVGAEPFECHDDQEAIDMARDKVDGRPAELWRQAHMVMDFPATRQTRTG